MQLLPVGAQPGQLELNDANFEHLTQASTGQTTGTWWATRCANGAAAGKGM
jgi:hypothetical protein